MINPDYMANSPLLPLNYLPLSQAPLETGAVITQLCYIDAI